ncbi:2,3,4,5-tetrahydropyridine-2,6-dicarboxylate N-acetyltransferase [compost metagenome]
MHASIEALVIALPNAFSKYRIRYWRKKGYQISLKAFIARNVVIQGRVSIDDGASISENCSFSGSSAGITIGKKVMIAPNCVIVAFDHGFSDIEVPMIDQPYVDAPVTIEDDVWIAANSTIKKGVRLGQGSIVGANSLVTKDVEPYAIVGGVPAMVIRSRKRADNNSAEG